MLLTKSEKRELKKLKAKNAPKGAKLSGQVKRLETSKFYARKKKSKT